MFGRSRCVERSHAPVRSVLAGSAPCSQIAIWSAKTYRSFCFRAYGWDCLAHAGAWRAALRAHRRVHGAARFSPHVPLSSSSGKTPGAALSEDVVRRPPGTNTTWGSWKTRSRSGNERRSQRKLTEQARAIGRRRNSGQAARHATTPEILQTERVQRSAKRSTTAISRRPAAYSPEPVCSSSRAGPGQ